MIKFLSIAAAATAFLFLPAVLPGQVLAGKELVRLDPKKLVHEIAINSTVATTITFPEKITLLTGFGLVTDPAAVSVMAQSRVSLVHYESVVTDTLVVRLLKEGEPCHATIRTAKNIYLLRFVPSEFANLAVIVPEPVERSAAVEATPENVVASRLNLNSEELVGILSRAKARKALQPLNPTLYTNWEERNGLEMATTVGDITCTIYEIQRWPAKDANIYRCWITNKGTQPFEFEPNGVKVRVGERSYPAQLVDCSGIVQPNQKVPLDVITQGNVGGGREDLSIKQEFRIELPLEGRNGVSAALFGDAGAQGTK